MIKLKNLKVMNIIMCVLTICAFSINLDIVDLPEGQPQILYLTRSFGEYSVLQVFAVPVLYCFYQFVNVNIMQSENKRESLAHSMLAVLFTIFMLLGYSYETNADWNLVMNVHRLQWLKVMIAFIGYYIFFDRIFAWLLSLFQRKQLWFAGENSSWFERWLEKHTYAKVLAIFILGYIPYIVCSYPATVVPDTVSQIVQSYNELEQWTPYYCTIRHLNENVYLNAHHPVVHTLFMHWCIEIGRKCFSSYNIGLFIYALLQAIFQIAIFSAVIATLVKIRVRWYWILLVMLYYMTAPGIVSYVMLGTKDTFYTSFVILFILVMFDILCNGKCWRNIVFLYLSSLGIMLFRNDGKYVLLLSVAIVFISCKNMRKSLLFLFISMLFVSVVYSELLLPYFSITSGSRREMLSIPFQQTARYVRDASDGVTQEEQEAIDAVLDYKNIAGKYDPERSDNVKGTYNELATREELKEYLRVWFKMFLKHPSHYVQAVINNYYYYFYPGEREIVVYGYSNSSRCMNDLNERGEKLDMDFHYPVNTEGVRKFHELIRNEIANLPIVSMIMSASTYTWGVLLIIGYIAAHRIKRGIPLIAALCVIFLICLAGPCNGWYYRYLYPVAASLPLVYFTVFYVDNAGEVRKNETQEGRNGIHGR